MDITAHRHGGNASSNAAYARSKGRHGAARHVLYALILTSDGLTSKELGERTGWALNTFSGRLAELKRDGLIRGTGERRNGAEVLQAVRVAEQKSLFAA